MGLPPLGTNPLVSVVIPNYNYGVYLPLAIKSVLRQSYEHFEVVICDDGSTDNSWEVLMAYAENPRVKITRKSNGGPASAWSKAYQLVEGEIICFLDSDDTFRPTKLAEVVQAFSSDPQSGLCTHFLQPMSKHGRPLSAPLPRILDSGWLASTALSRGGQVCFPPSSGISIRNQIGEIIFPIPEKLMWTQDAYLSRAGMFLTRVVTIPQILANYRWHGRNINARKKHTINTLAFQVDTESRLHQALIAFLTSRLGEEAASCIRLEESESYRNLLFWLYIFEGKRRGYVRHYAIESILNQLSPGLKSTIRKILVSLPPPISQILYRFWSMRPYLFYWPRSLKVRTLE